MAIRVQLWSSMIMCFWIRCREKTGSSYIPGHDPTSPVQTGQWAPASLLCLLAFRSEPAVLAGIPGCCGICFIFSAVNLMPRCHSHAVSTDWNFCFTNPKPNRAWKTQKFRCSHRVHPHEKIHTLRMWNTIIVEQPSLPWNCDYCWLIQ